MRCKKHFRMRSVSKFDEKKHFRMRSVFSISNSFVSHSINVHRSCGPGSSFPSIADNAAGQAASKHCGCHQTATADVTKPRQNFGGPSCPSQALRTMLPDLPDTRPHGMHLLQTATAVVTSPHLRLETGACPEAIRFRVRLP